MHHIDRLQFNLFFILFLSFHVFSIYFFFSLCVRKWIFLAKQKPNNNTESKKNVILIARQQRANPSQV